MEVLKLVKDEQLLILKACIKYSSSLPFLSSGCKVLTGLPKKLKIAESCFVKSLSKVNSNTGIIFFNFFDNRFRNSSMIEHLLVTNFHNSCAVTTACKMSFSRFVGNI